MAATNAAHAGKHPNGVNGHDLNGEPPKKKLILNAFVEMCMDVFPRSS